MATNPVLENLGLQIRDLIENIIANSFILDFGVVTAVGMNANGITTVTVQHSVLLNKLGTVLPPTTTQNVEVMWHTSNGLSTKGSVAVGDTVLLVGLKDYLASIASASPTATDIPFHHTQETMKAIAMGPYNASATHTIDASGTVMKIDGGTNGAARQNDATQATAITDAAFFTFLAAVATFMGVPGTAPTSLTGKITGGSTKVDIG